VELVAELGHLHELVLLPVRRDDVEALLLEVEREPAADEAAAAADRDLKLAASNVFGARPARARAARE
jgi:hypothetical protein